jgi:beta-hydroxylase
MTALLWVIVGGLALTGALVWASVAFGITVRVLRSGRVVRRLETRQLLPYTLFAKYRVLGAIGALAAKMGAKSSKNIAKEVVDAYRAIELDDMKHLRDIFVEMDTLPTVQRGLQAVHLHSMFEMSSRAVHRIPSPYTHPMQYPPYLIPGVPARTFYEAAEFEWATILEREYPVIKRELMTVLGASGAGFKGYMSEANYHHTGWNTFNFWFGGKKFEENCERCPETTRILESLPRFEKDHIMFSALNPHKRIPHHTGPMNGILRGHLGLVVPQGCYIRVGPDERTWEEGKVMVFDDSFEHEVFNHSDFVRIVLFMNFWHPCFSEQEIKVMERFRTAYERSPLSMVHKENQDAKRAHDMEVARVPAKTAA